MEVQRSPAVRWILRLAALSMMAAATTMLCTAAAFAVDASPSPGFTEPGVPGVMVTPAGSDTFPFLPVVGVGLIMLVVFGLIALMFAKVGRHNPYDPPR